MKEKIMKKRYVYEISYDLLYKDSSWAKYPTYHPRKSWAEGANRAEAIEDFKRRYGYMNGGNKRYPFHIKASRVKE